jgi:hypothetical protein
MTMRPGRNPLLDRLDPRDESAMRDLIGGALRTQAIYVVTKLQIPDRLASGPRSAADLAEAAGVDADALRRVMRYLVTCGVFEELDDATLRLTPRGEYLQSGHPRSLRLGALRAGEGLWQTVAGLLNAVTHGSTPHDDVHGAAFFEGMGDDDRAARFAARMNSSAEGIAEALAQEPCFRDARVVADIGGAHGLILRQLVTMQPHLRGVLFDTPEMIDSIRETLPPQIATVSGDFFLSVPPADVYVLSWILHDWDDAKAVTILTKCRGASPHASLAIVEVLLPSRAEALAEVDERIADPFTIDMQMLLLTGGRERTAEEYGQLLEKAGYELKRQTLLPVKRGAFVMTAVPTDRQGP